MIIPAHWTNVKFHKFSVFHLQWPPSKFWGPVEMTSTLAGSPPASTVLLHHLLVTYLASFVFNWKRWINKVLSKKLYLQKKNTNKYATKKYFWGLHHAFKCPFQMFNINSLINMYTHTCSMKSSDFFFFFLGWFLSLY